MRRADRLFRIVQYLRGRRLTTAAQLSGWLEVSMRTIYRDVRDLSLSGVPIEGEAGIGYRLGAGYDLPPLMFDRAELQALAAGARIVAAWSGPETARAAASAVAKIAAALPEDARIELERTRLYAPPFATSVPGGIFDRLHRAIAQREVMLIGNYRDQQQAVSERSVWPLGLYFWGAAWTLAGWCELRDNFRQFRLDRIGSLEATGRTYPDEAGRRLEDFVRFIRSRPD